MFRDFAPRNDDWVPALEEIRLFPEPKEDHAYKDECAKLEVEMMDAGVTLHLGEEQDEEW